MVVYSWRVVGERIQVEAESEPLVEAWHQKVVVYSLMAEVMRMVVVSRPEILN